MKTLVYNVAVKTKKNAEFAPEFVILTSFLNEPKFETEVIAETETEKVYKVTTTIKNDEQAAFEVKNKFTDKFTAKVKLVEATNDEGFAISIQGRRAFVIKNPFTDDRKVNIKEGMRKKAFVKKMNAAKAAKKAKLAEAAATVANMVDNTPVENEVVVYQEA